MMNVNIVKLAPMRVASARAFSETPERDAWEKLRAWAKPKGLLEDRDQHPVFGFNNPNPWRRTHELEKPHDLSAPEQDLVVDLYLPIEAI